MDTTSNLTLYLISSLRDEEDKLVIGKSKGQVVEVEVENRGEPAFQSLLLVNVTHPLALFLPDLDKCRFPDSHMKDRTSLQCRLASPIANNTKVS